MSWRARTRRPAASVLALLALLVAVSGRANDQSGRAGGTTEDEREQARLRGTVDDLVRLGRALQSWVADHAHEVKPEERLRLAEEAKRASAAAGPMPNGFYIWREGPLRKVSANELSRMLRPTSTVFYIRNLPTKDRWGRKLELLGSPENLFGRELFALRSAGPNGRFEGPRYARGAWESGAADDDLVWADGALVRWPAGVAGTP